MKKCFFLFAMALASANSQAQTLITYGSNTVGKDEFLRAYNKNKTPVTDKEKSIRDYIDLYANFKLKVKAAETMRLDTSAQLVTDLQNFRQQIEENYMNDDKAINVLLDEAFIRSQQDLHVIRFTSPIDESNPADSARVYKAFMDAYGQVKSGNTNYATLTTPDVKWADMGFVTVFSLPYVYENIVYDLKPGEVSKPYRSKKAWHFFKLTEQRRSAGKWRIAQILFSFPPNAEEATLAATRKLADSVYQLALNGSEFASLARTYSDDKLTYLTGGEMTEFGTGKFDYQFEKEVFSLNKDGDISKPFSTLFGIHIVKRLGFTPTPTDRQDAALAYELKQKLMQDDRVKAAKEKFTKEVASKIGLKVIPSVKQEDLFRFADTVMNDPMGESANTLPISSKNILSFAKGTAKGADWLNFVRDFKTNPEMYKGETYPEIWEKYKSVAALDYYRKHLEDYSPEFRYQLQEFREGNMLFEVMEKKVWSQAANDTVGLKAYYKAHMPQYKWSASADVLIMNCISEKLAKDALDSLKAGKDWRELVELKQGELQGDSGRFELSQLNGSEKATAGAYSDISINADGSATFIRYYRFYEADQQRSFEDSRGMVINDYQQVLEKKWLEELKKKYPVKVNEAVVKELIR